GFDDRHGYVAVGRTRRIREPAPRPLTPSPRGEGVQRPVPSPASGGRGRWWRFNRRGKGREVAFQQAGEGREVAFQQAAAGAGVRRTRRPALGGPSLRSCQPRSVAGGFLGFRGGVLHRAGSVGSGFAGGVGGLVRGLLGLGGSLIHGGVGLGGRFLGGGF